MLTIEGLRARIDGALRDFETRHRTPTAWQAENLLRALDALGTGDLDLADAHLSAAGRSEGPADREWLMAPPRAATCADLRARLERNRRAAA